jgi:hypothetical protein
MEVPWGQEATESSWLLVRNGGDLILLESCIVNEVP